MNHYIKHMKSLATKSRSRAKCRKSVDSKTSHIRSRSSSGDLGANPSGSGESISAQVASEARVQKLISSHMSRLSSSFAAFMEASFHNIERMIDDQDRMFLTYLFQLPRQYHSDCPLARDDRIPPCLAPVQDMEILGVNHRSRCWLSRLSLLFGVLAGCRYGSATRGAYLR